jgi:5'-nucleotidase (lipoprotein e(P4) family)
MKARHVLFLASLVLGASVFSGVTQHSSAQQAAPAPIADLDYQISGILYTQKSAEYRALAYQAYNLARLRLDEDFEKRSIKKLPKVERKRPRAIVVDIDETVLDNSPSNAKSAKTGVPFNLTDWYAWGEMRKAKPVPGSVDFLNYAVSRGVRIYYVSNRDEVQKQATIDNLQRVGFKDVTAENVLLRQNNSSPKEPRREYVSEKYRIVLLVGDNLDDFSSVFERKSTAERFASADEMRELWGKRFIVLPNAMYGTWENALYEYARLTEPQKQEKRAALLELP